MRSPASDPTTTTRRRRRHRRRGRGPSLRGVRPGPGEVGLSGRTRDNKLVHLAGGADWIGRLVTVRVEHAGPATRFEGDAGRVTAARPPLLVIAERPTATGKTGPRDPAGPRPRRRRDSPPRSSAPIRDRSTAGSTSGPPSRPSTSAAAFRTTGSISSIRTARSRSPTSPTTSRRCCPRSPRPAGSRSSPAAPASTSGRSPAASTRRRSRPIPRVRATIEATLAELGVAAAAARLQQLAPTLAGRIDLRNPRRVARALEIAEIAGDVPLPEPLGVPGPRRLARARRPPGGPRSWIAERARAQFEAGLVEEARGPPRALRPGPAGVLGDRLRESWALLDGEIDRETAIERDAARNVAFAKRQRTWFRREPDIEWLDPAAGDPLDRTLARAREILRRP